MEHIVIVFFAVLCAGIGLYAMSLPQGDRRWWALAGLVAALVFASLLAGDSWAGVLLLDAAELAAVALVWVTGTAASARAARTYLLSIVPAIACTIAGLALAHGAGTAPPLATEKLVLLLLIVGFALKLGLIPFYFWLPQVAVSTAPMTAALVISVVDIAAFAELANLRAVSPWVFGDFTGVWIAVALLSLFGGGILALAQRSVRRMLAFSTIQDMGYLVLGLVVGGATGISGAWLGALSHALSKVILFGAVGVAERGLGVPVTLDTRGLAARFPLASAAFVIGALSFIGAPPAFGFLGRWRLYLAGAQFDTWMLVAMVAASLLDLLIYARVIHRTWLGNSSFGATRARPDLASGVLAALALVALLSGIFPMPFIGLSDAFTALVAAR